MNVSEAIASRISVREFLDKPVADDLLKEILKLCYLMLGSII